MKSLRLKTTLITWGIPLVISIVIVTGYHNIFASSDPSIDELAAYLEGNSLRAASEVVDGYQHIFYAVEDSKFHITDGPQNNTSPVTSNEYIAWAREHNGGNQIVLYNVLTKTFLRLTHDGTNQNPVIDGNKVVWERWTSAGWQIFVYDGFNTRQISQGGVSVRPQIRGSEVVYAQKLEGNNNDWQIIVHDIDTDNANVIATGDETNAWPHFVDDQVTTKFNPNL